MRRTHLRSWPVALLATSTLFACASDLDTTRPTPIAKTTLGEEIYTSLCDRVGASSLSEDLSGQSYRAICHKGSKGWATPRVQTSVLPPAVGAAVEPRRLAIAKIEAMGERRADLIEALDALLPDVTIDDPLAPGQAARQVRLHDALGEMMRRLTPLYESNPYSTAARPEPPLLPTTSRALGQLMASLADSDEARSALSRISGREGYRPLDRSLGAVRTVLAYPRLRRLTTLLLDRTGPGGPLEGRFQQVLRVAEQELRTLAADPAVAPLKLDESTLQPSRPRSKVELMGTMFLGEADEYARGTASRLLASRDLRGFVVPLGATPGVVGTVPAPFVDADADGYADVDPLGRFLTLEGAPLLATPFLSPASPLSDGITFDGLGRASRQGQPLFRYVDTSRTLLHAVLDDMRPLTATADGGSTVMKALEGAFVLYGPRLKASRDYALAGSGQVTVPYAAFDSAQSPLVDLVHATGQILGAPESDDYLGSMLALHEQRPATTARALQLAWSLQNRSKDPQYAAAVLSDSSTFWEDMTAWLARVARVGPDLYTGPKNAAPRGLLGDLTVALGSPAAVQYLPLAFGPPMRHLDRISYNPGAINGPPLNYATTKPISPAGAFSSPVDRSLPDQGDNRSAFQRFAHIIAAANHVNTCNRPKALVKSNLKLCGLTIPLTYPLDFNPFDDKKSIPACDLLQINDLGVFFVDSTLPWDHPRRARLKIKDATLLGLLERVDDLAPSACGELDIDSVLQASTGLTGMTTTPTPQALMRLVFFASNGLVKGQALTGTRLDPFITSLNANLDTFVSNALDLVGTRSCPQNADGVNVCDTYEQTLRGIEPGTFFVAETPYLASHPPECLASCQSQGGKARQFCEAECKGPSSGFFEGLRPVFTAFANYSYLAAPGDVCTTDLQGRCVGEQLFLDLMGILDRHWSTEGSSLYRYEDFLAWALSPESDLFGTLSEIVPAMDTVPYTSTRVQPGQVRTPLAVTASMVSYLFDPAVSASLGVTDRNGTASTVANDGTAQPQTTPYQLMVQALRGFDARMGAADPATRTRWKQARSSLVDQFLLASDHTWTNQAIARALPAVGRAMREQINAHCPARETNRECDWARRDLARTFASVLDGPLFAAINDLTEGLRADPELREEIEQLVGYLLQAASDPDALALTLTTVGDLLQVLNDDQAIAPALRALSPAASPSVLPTDAAAALSDPAAVLKPAAAPGTATTSLTFLRALLAEPAGQPDRAIDRYHAIDRVLPLLVTPVGASKRAPLEVIIDTIAAVQRLDSSDKGAFAPVDYRTLARGLQSFLIDDRRGMEQFYTIVRGRDGDQPPP